MTTSPQRAETARLVKEAADIVTVIGEHVQLKRSGANLKGVCPFHAEKTPSFMVQPERQTFHCFGCGEGGDVFTFVMKYHNLTFPEALQELAQRFNVTLPERAGGGGQDQEQAQKRQALLDANEQAAILYHRLLLEAPEAADARAYLAKRGVPAELAERFRLGYAPNRWDFLVKALPAAGLDLEMALAAGLIVKKEHGGFYDRFRDRVQFPILNLSGQIVGFGGRIRGDGQPKYLNSPESPVFEKGRVLFGLYQNREAVRQARRCLLVEGNFDLLALLAHGFANAAAPLGTALTPAHIRTLKGYCDETILLFDGDTAGEKAATRAVPLFLSEQVTARVVLLPGSHDPDTFLAEYGAEELTKMLAEAQSLPEFFFASLVRRHGLTVEGKSRIVSELGPVIAAIGDNQMQRTVFVAHFSEKLGIAPAQMLGGVSRLAVLPRAASSVRAADQALTLSLQERQLLEFLIAYPEYVERFLAAGLADLVTSSGATEILARLQALGGEEQAAGSEYLLDSLVGPERAFVSRVLLNTPAYSVEQREAIAGDQLAWLAREGGRVRRERLTRLLGEAQQANNEALCLELMARLRDMDQGQGVSV